MVKHFSTADKLIIIHSGYVVCMGKRNVCIVLLGRPYWKTIFGVLELRVSWEDTGTMDIRQQNIRMDIRPTEFICGVQWQLLY